MFGFITLPSSVGAWLPPQACVEKACLESWAEPGGEIYFFEPHKEFFSAVFFRGERRKNQDFFIPILNV